jgi:hypothetical protein
MKSKPATIGRVQMMRADMITVVSNALSKEKDVLITNNSFSGSPPEPAF